MITATSTEMQNNFGKFLALVIAGQQIVVTKNGHEIGRFIPKNGEFMSLTDSLTGILKEDRDLYKEKTEEFLAMFT